jgi:hypothetical protein
MVHAFHRLHITPTMYEIWMMARINDYEKKYAMVVTRGYTE